MLRTEKLPAGIFANTSGRTSPELNDKTPTNFSEHFALQSQEPPKPIVITNSDTQAIKLVNKTHQRKLSDGYSSQMTDDEDDRTNSLHVLTDEQLEDLACIYHPLPISTTAAETGTTKPSSIRMPDSLLFSLSNPLSKLVLR